MQDNGLRETLVEAILDWDAPEVVAMLQSLPRKSLG